MQDLFKLYTEYTDKRFDDIKEDLHDLGAKIDDLREFKVEMVATSRLVSFIISAVSGLITLIISTIVSIKYHQ